MLKTPKIYRLIAALVLVVTCPITAFAADDYFPSLAQTSAPAPGSAIEQPAKAQQSTDENIKKIKDIELHGLNVVSEDEVLSKLNLHRGDAYKK